MFNNLAALVAKAKEYGVKHVVVVGPVPRYNTALHQMVIRKYWFNTPKRVNENFAGDVFPTDTWLKNEPVPLALNTCLRWILSVTLKAA